MIVVACVDLKNGMMFNNRRQSQDRLVRQDIFSMVGKERVWMNNYSYKQFKDDTGNIVVDEDFLQKANSDEYCFVENMHLKECSIDRIVLYRWDKNYPADFLLDINLSEWNLVEQSEFAGYSHDKITKEVYVKNEK